MTWTSTHLLIEYGGSFPPYIERMGNMENKSLHEVIGKLESLFSTFNKHFFNNELEKPIITVSPDTTKGAYGWCTSWKA